MHTLSRNRPHLLTTALPKSLPEGLIGGEASSIDQSLGPLGRLRAPVLGEV